MRFIVPIHVIDYTGAPGGVQAGFKKFYLQNGYFKLYNGTTISDVVLDRPLDNYTPLPGTITANDTVLTALEKLAYAISNVSSNQSLQDTVNIGNSISNFVSGSYADIQSTNFVNNRTLYLNNDAFATIKIVDNLNAAHNLTIDLDTVTINGIVYNWSTIVAGSQTLTQVLFSGNETLGKNIKVNNADAIELENTSLLKKGTYDYGGAGGISRICSIGYEDMWQSGIRHVFDNNGLIRNSTNCFNIIPDNTFDNTLRFKVGSLWTLDNGDTYECTNADLNAAVWVLKQIGVTNLDYVPEPTQGTVTSDAGDDAIIPLADETNAGLLSPSEKVKIEDSVPYTGATQDVDLGLFDITAAHIIKDGGQPQQFLKADGSVDNNTYLTSADLPSTLDLFATTSPDPDIPGYTALVRNITDARYNTTAQNVLTPTITGTVLAPTFCGAVISDPSILLGNPGVFNFSVIGKIRRTGGSTSSGADFFFSIYKRNLAGTETLIAESAPVVVPANGGTYVEYISIALWNDGIFLSTDRVVLKFYGIKTGGGTGATYEFLFGGADPVRGTAAISSAIIPNIYLKDLADVEKVPALNNEVLYWNDADSLWEHSLAEDLVPDATATQKGLVSTGTQTIAGAKTFTSQPTIPANGGNLGQGAIIIDNGSGLVQVAYNGVYPNLPELETVKGITTGVTIQSQLNGKQDYATATTGYVISFATPQIYNDPTVTSSSDITNSLGSAKIGIVQKIYHNKTVAPTFPAGWVKLGTGVYTVSVLNIIYAEWVSGSRVEYWIVKGI